MTQLPPGQALEGLRILLGEWTIGSPQFPEIRGSVTFELIEGGAFLVERSDPRHPPFPSSTSIIGRDDGNERYFVLYNDSRGVSRVYQMTLDGGAWKMWREAPGFSQRFTATFSDDGNSVRGSWEKSEDGSAWQHDFDLTYSKVR